MPADDEAAQRQALADRQHQVVRTGDGRGGVVIGDRAAQRQAAVDPHRAERCLQMVTADVVEIDIQALGRGAAQLPRQVAGVVVEDMVETDPAAVLDLVSRSDRADHGAAADLGDLAHQAADGARRTRDKHRLAGFERGNVQQADVSRHARHAEHAEVGRGRRHRVGDARDPGAIADEGLAPTEVARDQVTRRETRVPALEHPADRTTLHHFADLPGRRVRLHVAHAPAHVRVDAHRQVLYQ